VGLKGALSDFSYSLSQVKFLIQGCYLTSDGPLKPNLFDGFLCIILLMKSIPSADQPDGASSGLI